jgi:hypothetical protein
MYSVLFLQIHGGQATQDQGSTGVQINLVSATIPRDLQNNIGSLISVSRYVSSSASVIKGKGFNFGMTNNQSTGVWMSSDSKKKKKIPFEL